jgi:branched-chain amino acid aminotransferase
MTLAWINGAVKPATQINIDPADRGFLLADGLFETLRAENGIPLHAPRHLARLRAGAAILALPLPWPDDALLQAMAEILAAHPSPQAAIRLTLTRGPAPRGVLPSGAPRPTCLITAAPLPPPPPPARVIIASVTRRNEHSPLSRMKTLNYLDSILARQEAERRGADDAILLNTAGRVAEASAGNLFIMLGHEAFTPPIAEGALPGIARALILEQGAATERELTPADLHRSEAACIVNSLHHRPIISLDGRALPPLAWQNEGQGPTFIQQGI